jgi:hypothetical protein
VIGRPVLVHYHIFKNAGTSVDVALQRSFGPRWTTFEGRHALDVQTSEQLGRFLESRPEVCAVSSHLARPPLPFPGCRPIVFLRHPLLRVRSVQEFTRRNPEQPGCPISQRGTLATYVKWALDARADEGGWVIRDCHVTHLSDASWRTQERAVVDDLHAAKSLIESWGIVGIVEDYKMSARRFQAMYAAEFPDLDFIDVRANRTSAEIPDIEGQTQALRKELGSELFERLVEANQLDLELYNWAVARFPRFENVTASDGGASGSTEDPTVEKLRDEFRYLAADWEARVRSQDDLIAQRDALVRIREGEIAQYAASASAHDELIARHKTLANAHNDLYAQYAQLARVREAELAEREARASAHNDLSARHAELARMRNGETAEYDALAQSHRSLTAEHDALAGQRDGIVAERDAMLASWSWRLTAPVRWLRNLFVKRVS